MKTCPKCKIEKELKDFNNNKNKKDGKQRICRECTKKEHLLWYNKDNNKQIQIDKNKIVYKNKREKFINYKKTCECKKCGEKRWYVLDFHHLDPLQKDFEISGHVTIKNNIEFWNEIKKCIPLCRNCHAEFHHLEKTENIKIEEYLSACNSVG